MYNQLALLKRRPRLLSIKATTNSNIRDDTSMMALSAIQ